MRIKIILLFLLFSNTATSQQIIHQPVTIAQKNPVTLSLGINYKYPQPGSTITSMKFEIYWREYVLRKTGNINVRNYYNDSIVQQIDVTSAAVQNDANYTAINLASLPPGLYYLQIEAGAFANLSNEPYAGTNQKEWWFIISGDDGFPLKLQSYSPDNKTFHIKGDGAKLQLRYNKYLKPATGILNVNQFETDIRVGYATVSVKDSVVTLTTSIFSGNTRCYVSIPAGYFRDINNFYTDTTPGKSSWSFTTAPSPRLYTFDFTSCSLPYTSDFRNANSQGSQTWQCGEGYKATTGAVINGNINNVPEKNRDWLITPAIDLSGMEEPMVRFYSKTQYNGMPLKLLVSLNYTGEDTAGSYTWKELNGKFPVANSNSWTLSDSISLLDYKSKKVHLCFQYNSTTDAAAEWSVDSITIFSKPYNKNDFVTACAGDMVSFTSGLTGNSYQWQENRGNGFVDIFNYGGYSGTTGSTLQINNFPSYYSGYEYRCVINGNAYSSVKVLSINNFWIGAANSAWENPLNWSCGKVPDEYTDITISSGSPVVNSKVICRSLHVSPGVSLKVNTGYSVIVRN